MLSHCLSSFLALKNTELWVCLSLMAAGVCWPCFVGCKVQIDSSALFADRMASLPLLCYKAIQTFLCSAEAGIEATYPLNNGLIPVNPLVWSDGRVLHKVPLIGFNKN